jgi:hypothetical protein
MGVSWSRCHTPSSPALLPAAYRGRRELVFVERAPRMSGCPGSARPSAMGWGLGAEPSAFPIPLILSPSPPAYRGRRELFFVEWAPRMSGCPGSPRPGTPGRGAGGEGSSSSIMRRNATSRVTPWTEWSRSTLPSICDRRPRATSSCFGNCCAIDNAAARSSVASIRWESIPRIFTVPRRSSMWRSMDRRMKRLKVNGKTKPVMIGCVRKGLRY